MEDFRCFSPELLVAQNVTPATTRGDTTINLELHPWASAQLSTIYAAIVLKEALGYKIKFICANGGNGAVTRIGKGGSAHILTELWDSNENHEAMRKALSRREIVSVGELGYDGLAGLFVPSYLEPRYPDVPIDVWTSLKLPQVVSLFAPEDDTQLIAALNLTQQGEPFTPPWCSKWNASGQGNTCIDVKAELPQYEKGMLQQFIMNMKLNLTISFWGLAGLSSYIDAKHKQSRPIMFKFFVPSEFLAKRQESFKRITLPAYTQTCEATNTFSTQGLGDFMCDFPLNSIVKVVSPRLASSNVEDLVYSDALKFLRAMLIDFQTLQTQLLQPLASGGQVADYTDYVTPVCALLRNQTDTWATAIGNAFVWEEWEMDTHLRNVIIVLFSVVSLLCCVTAAVYWKHRKHLAFRQASARLSVLILLGFQVGLVASLTFVFPVSQAACTLRLLCGMLGVGSSVTIIMLKIHRLDRIFTSTATTCSSLCFTTSSSKGSMVLFGKAVVLVAGVALHPGLDISKDVLVSQSPVIRLTTLRYCGTFFDYWSILAVTILIFAQVLYSLFLAYKLRNVPNSFSEKHEVVKSLVTFVCVFAVITPLAAYAWQEDSFSLSYFLTSLALCLLPLVNMVQLFAPRIFEFYFKNKEQRPPPFDQTPGVQMLNYQRSSERAS
eukprot:CAMPEP_0175135722 /NCGR_PEP_ID=MMETSP0087-20121206/8890_1 /TAXON_ID=136419 /ORGANISM="Unknown Unknown, Strain D1" /LENGTH=664 /DNA_ID=CAMNT_0016418423 /DNA_START=84 /DNA_END=2078 /DNA_ORIENTATION=+